VNIRGYFFMSVEAGKLMRENGGGSIINVASINGVSPSIFQGIYSVTKALALVKNEAILNTALQQIPLKRVADPSGMAKAVLYLASDVSSYVTGVSLNVDGGFLS
jgi:NAD(P)-dependent dehydrogenase (short-subunit alcohol dehydrogenase family)